LKKKRYKRNLKGVFSRGKPLAGGAGSLNLRRGGTSKLGGEMNWGKMRGRKRRAESLTIYYILGKETRIVLGSKSLRRGDI